MSSLVKCSSMVGISGDQRRSEGQSRFLHSSRKPLGAAEAPLPLVLIYLLLRLFVLVLGCWQLCKLR